MPMGVVSSPESQDHRGSTCRAKSRLLSQTVAGFPCVSGLLAGNPGPEIAKQAASCLCRDRNTLA